MKRVLIALALFLFFAEYAEAQSRRFTIPGGVCDGRKFAERYKLNPRTDFWMEGSVLVLRDGVTMPNDPPICEASNSQVVVARDRAKAEIDKEIALKAIVLLVLDEFNLHADKHNAILDAVDAATSLADLKTRVAAIPNYPQRTAVQLINAIKAKIDAGQAE
jgi:hypothetical protein